MAAPPELTLKDLSGNYVMNKTLSDDTDPVLSLQGIGWLTRKALSIATVYLAITQYTDEQSVTHVDIAQTATGGIKGTAEARTLDWVKRKHEDHIFGGLEGQSRWSTFQEIDDDFLKQGWEEGDNEAGGPNGEKHIESYVVNEGKGWTARQLWGFAVVDGNRYYVRRVVIKKGDTTLRVRLVYNYTGK